MARWDRYAEAFWWVVPIPALVVVSGGLAAVDPSPAAVVGAFVLAMVGLSVETHLWQMFRRRWAGDPEAHPTSGSTQGG
ncbi:MAG: hypothetical protein M3011_09580 [Actinomycetota bacterium]|nr:hypothetical protein [Actinomycetota bacterium]